MVAVFHSIFCLQKTAGWSLSNPSAGLFESYEFKDGTPFSYDDSRYNPDNLGENRDPRLDYTIYYNGATFMGTEYRMSPDYEASKKERLDYSSEASKTGFMWRKYFDENPINDLNSYSAVTPGNQICRSFIELFGMFVGKQGRPLIKQY